jgi:hypothetical protein
MNNPVDISALLSTITRAVDDAGSAKGAPEPPV